MKEKEIQIELLKAKMLGLDKEIEDDSAIYELLDGVITIKLTDKSCFNIPSFVNKIELIGYSKKCSSITLSGGRGLVSLESLFYNTNFKTIDITSIDSSKVTSTEYMFYKCSSLTTIDLSNFNTSKVTSMDFMFGHCSCLTALDLSNFDTSRVISMWFMFGECSSLTTIDLSNFDTSKIIDIGSMFSNCSSLTTLDLSNFNTSKVTSMKYMFYRCSSLTTLDLSNFDTSKVTSMKYMFHYCSNLSTIDLSNFDTSKVTSTGNMFYGCTNLKYLDVSNSNLLIKVNLNKDDLIIYSDSLDYNEKNLFVVKKLRYNGLEVGTRLCRKIGTYIDYYDTTYIYEKKVGSIDLKEVNGSLISEQVVEGILIKEVSEYEFRKLLKSIEFFD